MTKTYTDEELYELAREAEPRLVGKQEEWIVGDKEYAALIRLRGAVLTRFKPREPRVVEQWGFVIGANESFVQCYDEERARSLSRADGRYLAKAVITEVMDLPKPPESE